MKYLMQIKVKFKAKMKQDKEYLLIQEKIKYVYIILNYCHFFVNLAKNQFVNNVVYWDLIIINYIE